MGKTPKSEHVEHVRDYIDALCPKGEVRNYLDYLIRESASRLWTAATRQNVVDDLYEKVRRRAYWQFYFSRLAVFLNDTSNGLV